ncbi:MAG: aryl-sulfate sulfotransferase [Balneolales bacterium]|nr:aryl-sulfate sulfotransferase [Balneolales bacterium]
MLNKTIYCGVYSMLLFSFLVMSCDNSTNSEPDEPSTEAIFLNFSILELPNSTFTINENTGMISINSGAFDDGTTSLTAVFEVSTGASVFVEDSLQSSGITTNDFSSGVTYTVVSEDESTTISFFVYVSEGVPFSYLFADEIGIELNPSGVAPLSAIATLSTNEETRVSFTILGQSPITASFDSFSDSHELAIHGLYANATNHVLFSATNELGVMVHDTVEITTAPIPDFFPELEIDVVNSSQMEEGLHFSEFGLGRNGVFEAYPFIFDNQGKVRWYLDLSEYQGLIWGITFMDNGTFYASEWNGVVEFDLFGNLLRQLPTPGYILHHDVIQLPNKNYVAISDKEGTKIIKGGQEITSVEDILIELDYNSGAIVNEWDIAAILDVNRIAVTDGGGDWFHMNSLWYSEEDSTFIISGRNQGVIKMDMENNLEWIIGAHTGWGAAGRTGDGYDTSEFLLTAVDASGQAFQTGIQDGSTDSQEFSWTWGQHAPMLLENGNLFIFDNGFNRNFGNATPFSMASEYVIDEQNKTIELAWSYGRERGSDTFSSIISDVDVLPNTQNRLFMPGFIQGPPNKAKIVEVTYPDGAVVFESTASFKNMFGNGNGWGQIDIIYRSERITLYE